MGYIQGADRSQLVFLPNTLDDYVSEDIYRRKPQARQRARKMVDEFIVAFLRQVGLQQFLNTRVVLCD